MQGQLERMLHKGQASLFQVPQGETSMTELNEARRMS